MHHDSNHLILEAAGGCGHSLPAPWEAGRPEPACRQGCSHAGWLCTNRLHTTLHSCCCVAAHLCKPPLCEVFPTCPDPADEIKPHHPDLVLCSADASIMLTRAGQYDLAVHLAGSTCTSWTSVVIAQRQGTLQANVSMPLDEVLPCIGNSFFTHNTDDQDKGRTRMNQSM